MSILKAENLYKTYGDKTLFDHISFHIEENERIGLIGPNGTGKSTLLKVIAGLESTEEGEITKSGSVQVEFLHQDPELPAGQTVLEHIYSGESAVMKTLREYEKALYELGKDPKMNSARNTCWQHKRKWTQTMHGMQTPWQKPYCLSWASKT